MMVTLCCVLACFTASLWLSDQSHLHSAGFESFHGKVYTAKRAHLTSPWSDTKVICALFTRIKVSAAYFMNRHDIFEPSDPSQTQASPRDGCEAGGLALCYTVRRRNSSWRHSSRWSKPSRAAPPTPMQQPGRWCKQDMTATPFTGFVILKH